MDEKILTPFEQAFLDYREANEDIEYRKSRIRENKEWIAAEETKMLAQIARRSDALYELKRRLTPEAFAELTAVQA